VASFDYIANVVDNLTNKFDTRDPFEICDGLGIKIRYKDLGAKIKAYYCYASRIPSIVINNRASERFLRILVAHELGHDRLHRELARQQVLYERDMFNRASAIEFQANVFAAELFFEDDEIIEQFKDEDKTFFSTAQEFNMPPELLDFKFRAMRHRGYDIDSPILARGDFLRKDFEGFFEGYFEDDC